MSTSRFAYDAPTVRSGAGAAGVLSDELETIGAERALVVTGRNVGANAEVVEPLREGLGERYWGLFAETTPDKRLGTAVAGLERVRDEGADTLIGVGGGSSLDVAKAIAALSTGMPPEEAGAQLEAEGTVDLPAGTPLDVVTVPTTLAGAELSPVAGITADPASCPVKAPASGAISDPRLLPALTVYDPSLIATTPTDVLAGSAMNGFDKGLETLYSRHRTPVTDATASEGLARLASALHGLRERPADPDVFGAIADGLFLVQYGLARPDGSTLSLLHALGHAVSRDTDVQQGIAHAVLAPHALEYLFGEVDGRRRRIADSLGVPPGGDLATGIVDEVTAIRDALELPEQLREIDGPAPAEFEGAARATLADPLMANAPAGLDPTVEEIVGIFEAAH